MRYNVEAYLCKNFTGLMDSLVTDNFYEVQDFVHEQCMKGFYCELCDMKTGNRGFIHKREVIFNDN